MTYRRARAGERELEAENARLRRPNTPNPPSAPSAPSQPSALRLARDRDQDGIRVVMTILVFVIGLIASFAKSC